MIGTVLVLLMGVGGDASAAEVLDRFVEVTGGAAAYESVGNLRVEGFYTGSHLRFYGVDQLPFETLVVGTEKWKRIWPTSGITETLLSSEGWRYYPDGGTNALRPISAGEHAFLVRDTPLARAAWRDAWDDATLVEDGEFDGEATDVVLLEAGALEVRRHFSKETGLLVRSVAKAGAATIEVTYEDYRMVGGVRLPHLTTVDSGPREHHIYHAESIGVGATVADSEFAKPGS